jgi:hypothetical protein
MTANATRTFGRGKVRVSHSSGVAASLRSRLERSPASSPASRRWC